MEPDHALPPWGKVDLGAMAIKGYSSITETLPSNCLVSYPEHSLGGGITHCRDEGYLFGEFYPSAEIQSVYSAAQSQDTRWERVILPQRRKRKKKRQVDVPTCMQMHTHTHKLILVNTYMKINPGISKKSPPIKIIFTEKVRNRDDSSIY